MFGRVKQFGIPIAIAVAIVVCLYACSPNFRFASGPQASPYGGDFLQEWLGGWIVRAGDHSRFYDPHYAYRLQHDPALVGFQWNEDEYLPVVYPPFYYLVSCPLSLASVQSAAWLWGGLMVASLAASLIMLLRIASNELKLDSFSHRRNEMQLIQFLPWIIPASFFFAPVLESLSSSQKGTVCLLIFTATYVTWSRGRAFSAGMLFGLILFKPQLALVIAVSAIWKRQWRFIGGLAITCAGLLALSLCLGVAVCWQYVEFALGTGEYMQTGGYDLHKSHSVWGFAALLMPAATGGLRLCFSLLAASLVVYQLTRILRREDWQSAPQNRERFALQFSALVIASVLLSPHLFTYDLTVLLLPMVLLVFRTGDSQATATIHAQRWLIALLYISPAISTVLAGTIGIQITVPIMLLLLSKMALQAERISTAVGPVPVSKASSALK